MNAQFGDKRAAQTENGSATEPNDGPIPTVTRCSPDDPSAPVVYQGIDEPAKVPAETNSVLNSLPKRHLRKMQAVQELLRKEHEQVVSAMGKALVHARRAGECLERLGDMAPKGLASKTREDACNALGISERTGYLYLRVHRHWKSIEEATKANGLSVDEMSLRRALAAIPTRTKKPRPPKPQCEVDVTPEKDSTTSPVVEVSPSSRDAANPHLAIALLVRDFLETGEESHTGANNESSKSAVTYVAKEADLNRSWLEKVIVDLLTVTDPGPWLEHLNRHLRDKTKTTKEAVVLLTMAAGPGSWQTILRLQNVLLMVLHPNTESSRDEGTPTVLLVYAGPRRREFAEALAHVGTPMVPIRTKGF
ncbi:MAG: hypothetical protein U0795_23480 [Pirellulales bacterium]